ncbi:hypothetical protein BC629DRAFT_1439177 [Irpex lacteus]|nr:hypothetical protein BC629DRAFT_1439177 [Irpex lacteus]
MSPEVIIAAWKKTGLSPLDPHIFTDTDFAPSNVTSTQSFMPDSFPSLVPESDPIPDSDDFDFAGSGQDSDSDFEDSATGSESDDDTTFFATDREIEATRALPSSSSTAQADPCLVTLDARMTKSHLIDVADRNQRRLARELAAAREDAEAAHSHCHFAQTENKTLKHQLNFAEKKTQRITLRTTKAHLTGPESMQLFRAQADADAQRAADAQKKQDWAAEKLVETEHRRAQLIASGSALRFTKPLSQCKRADLEDVVIILGMTVDAKDTMKTLLSRIQQQFTLRPELKQDARFLGLFPRTSRRHRAQREGPCVQVAENAAPIASTSALSSQATPRSLSPPSQLHSWPTDPPPSLTPLPQTPRRHRQPTPLSPSNGSRLYHYSPPHLGPGASGRFHPYSHVYPLNYAWNQS